MFVDANVLVVARAANAPGHEAALATMAATRREEPLRISRQVLREYLAVVTRPQTWAGPRPLPDEPCRLRPPQSGSAVAGTTRFV